ncbi:hypothetical protein [Senegalia massiliensis]|nr:hypothetical protein [Senegalia massiliensis]
MTKGRNEGISYFMYQYLSLAEQIVEPHKEYHIIIMELYDSF